MEKEKLLYIITKSNFGGAQRYVFDLATHISRDKYTVAVAFGGTGTRGAHVGALETKLQKANVRTIHINHFMRDVSFIEDIRAFFELLKIVRREQPDILHVTSSKAGGLGAFAGRLAGIRTIVFTSHGLTFDENWRPIWQRALIWLFTWWTILLSTKTIQISRDTFKRAGSMPFCRNKVALVHNGIESPTFMSHTEARNKLTSKEQNGLWIGTVAELHPNKNLQVLIEALAHLAKTSDIHLWIIGEGEEHERLQTLAEKKGLSSQVHLVGYMHDAARLLTAFDIFTLPSHKEGLPYVLLEAGFAGVPIVASDIGGNRDILEHGQSGLLVEPTVENMAQSLSILVKHKKRREELGAAMQKRVCTYFSVKHMLQQTTDLYISSKPSTSRSRSSLRTERS